MRGVAPNGAGDGWKITVGADCRGEKCCDYKAMGAFGGIKVSSNVHPHALQFDHIPSFVATVVILAHSLHRSSSNPCCECKQMGPSAV